MTHGYEQIGNTFCVVFPCLTILLLAFLDVSQCSMRYHTRKEERVEPWEGAVVTRDEAPREGEKQICSVIDLSSILIYNFSSQHYLSRA